MSTKQQKTEINGLTFTRWNYEGRMASERNAHSPWTLSIQIDEHDRGLVPTGEKTGIEIQVWADFDAVKINGAEAMMKTHAPTNPDTLAAADLGAVETKES